MIKIKNGPSTVTMIMDPKTAGMVTAAVTHMIKDHLDRLAPEVQMDAGEFTIEVARWLAETS